MAGKIDAFLKLGIVAGVLLASSSVAYYYVVYLPDRDARIGQRYDACLRDTQEIYASAWAKTCSSVAQDSVKQQRAECLAQGGRQAECESRYAVRDASPQCSLPKDVAEDIEARRDKSLEYCLQASKAGL